MTRTGDPLLKLLRYRLWKLYVVTEQVYTWDIGYHAVNTYQSEALYGSGETLAVIDTTHNKIPMIKKFCQTETQASLRSFVALFNLDFGIVWLSLA